MSIFVRSSLSIVMVVVFLHSLLAIPGYGQKMPREDVIHDPARRDGLCVSNVFQSNMVIQRDKPIYVWGWAEPAEEVRVTFSGEVTTVRTGQDGRWKATLPAKSANHEPQTLKVKPRPLPDYKNIGVMNSLPYGDLPYE